MSVSRRLLARLRELMAGGAGDAFAHSLLDEMVSLVAAELATEVCSVYAMRPGDLLELVATRGLKPDAVGRTRLRVGEGIVGLVAASGQVLNLPDAPNHPAFAYRPETGEEPYVSLLAVPVRRGGRTLGVLAVQSRQPRLYGDDEVDVLQTVVMLLAEVLAASGTREGAEESLSAAMSRQFAGTVLASGIAVGRILVTGSGAPPRHLLAEDPEQELDRLARAAEDMRRGLDELIATGLAGRGTRAHDGAAGAPHEVLEATKLLAADSGWFRRVAEVIRSGLTAEAAVHRVAGELRDKMRRIADPYLRERLSDLEDLAQRLMTALDGEAAPEDMVPPGTILLARRLGPAQLLSWHARGIAGVAIEEASSAGHAAILARALGIPALGGVRGALEAMENGDRVVLDADEGVLILRPDAELERTYVRILDERRARREEYAALRDEPARTADGVKLQLMLNVGLPLEMDQLATTGASGVGLFRTEITMLARGDIADVAEQTAIYARVLDAAKGAPVVFRTLDLGGDKLLPGAPLPEEENPAMGWRSLRIGLDRPALLRRQLRAMLLAAGGQDLWVMFPMVATLSEFRAARRLFWTEAARVRPAPQQVRLGTMLEIPALLWQLPALLAEADFVSVGTNDLMQFLFAADRGSPLLAGRYDLLSAPVLDLLEQVAQQAAAAGKPVSVCGEAASRPLEALALVAIGFHTLSMPATYLPSLKALLRQVDMAEFRSFLTTLRRGAQADSSLRETILSWARERDLPVTGE